jgi:hypothetical protein
MAFPPQQWETVRAYYERGLSLSEIVDRDDVRIKSRGSISKRAKAEGWIAGGKKQQVAREVLATQELEAVRAQKETLGAQERNVHDALVSETLRYQTFFRGANILVANAVAKKVKDDVGLPPSRHWYRLPWRCALHKNRLALEFWQAIRTVWESDPDEPTFNLAALRASEKYKFVQHSKSTIDSRAKKEGWAGCGVINGIVAATQRKAEKLTASNGSIRVSDGIGTKFSDASEAAKAQATREIRRLAHRGHRPAPLRMAKRCRAGARGLTAAQASAWV